MLNDISSLISHLATRRSSRPRDLVAPGPDPKQLNAMLTIAARTPDHGKLAPWSFVVIDSEKRDQFSSMLTNAYIADKPDAGRIERASVDAFAHQAPCLVVAISTPNTSSKIPLWEQQLSCGAATMNLVHAAHAHGFAAGWVTGWASYNGNVAAALGAGPDDRIAGFVFIGTPGESPAERIRPALSELVSDWPKSA